MNSRRPRRLGLLQTAALIVTVAAPVALVGQTDTRIAARLDSLEHAVKVLAARLREIEADSLSAAQTTRSSVSIDADGFQFRSADGAFRLKIAGYIQTDGRFYLDDVTNAGVDNLIVRRARPIIEGTIYNYFDFRLMPDFGQGKPTIYEARGSPVERLRGPGRQVQAADRA